MANNTSNTNNTILYNASTRENFNDWKHTVDSLLTKHPDKLLTVAHRKLGNMKMGTHVFVLKMLLL